MSVSSKMGGSPPSGLTEDDVKELFKLANISPTQFEYLLPKKDDRANDPPQGYMSVYKHQIENGLRFPLHNLVVNVCNRFKISPSQLNSIAHSYFVGFILWAKLYHTPVTVDNFWSLFHITQVPSAFGEGSHSLFGFAPSSRRKQPLLDRSGLSQYEPNWATKFFFLRPLGGKSWDCQTKWSVHCYHSAYDLLKGKKFEPQFFKCCFRVSELLHKDVLVHGGIEPGVPSPQFTFRYLMHRAAVTKFKLLPKDIPPANANIKVPNKSPPSPAAGGGMLNTLADFAAAPSPSEAPINEALPSTFENAVPQQELFHEEKDNCAAHKETNIAVLVSDKSQPQLPSAQPQPPSAQPQPPLTPLLAISKTLESMFVPKECYERLEKDKEEVTSELARAKSRVEELEREMELQKAKRDKSDYSTTHAMLKIRILEKRLENIKSDSDCLRDKMKKEVMDEFKSSDDFANAVHEEAVKYYINGFETCKLQVLNSGELPSGFNFDFLDVADSEWGSSDSSPMPVDNAVDDLNKKSLKRKKT